MQPMSPRERVAATVRAELARQRKSGSAMARDLGMTQSRVSRRLNGDVAFDLDELEAIAHYLAIPLAALIGNAAPSPAAVDVA